MSHKSGLFSRGAMNLVTVLALTTTVGADLCDAPPLLCSGATDYYPCCGRCTCYTYVVFDHRCCAQGQFHCCSGQYFSEPCTRPGDMTLVYCFESIQVCCDCEGPASLQCDE